MRRSFSYDNNTYSQGRIIITDDKSSRTQQRAEHNTRYNTAHIYSSGISETSSNFDKSPHSSKAATVGSPYDTQHNTQEKTINGVTDPLSLLREIQPGSQIFSETKLVTRHDLVRYAGASGDFNPIHYRDDFARAVGLPGVICHGMLTMALAIAPLMAWLGPHVSRLLSYGVRFSRPVPVPVGEDPLDERSVGALLLITGILKTREPEKVNIELVVSMDGKAVLTKAFAEISLKQNI